MYSRNCITSKGAWGGGWGLSLVLTRQGNADGAGWRGWKEEEALQSSLWLTHTRSLHLSCGVRALSTLATSPSGSLCLHLLGAIKWKRGGRAEGYSALPPPCHTYSQAYTLSLKLSHDAEYHSWLPTTLCYMGWPCCNQTDMFAHLETWEFLFFWGGHMSLIAP